MVELNISTGDRRYLPEMGRWRSNHGCTVVGRKVVVAGGLRDKTSEILDLDTETWSRAGDMMIERGYTQLVTVNGRVVVMGGKDGDDNTLDTVEELDMGQRTWRRLGVRMKRPRSGFGAEVMDKNILCP